MSVHCAAWVRIGRAALAAGALLLASCRDAPTASCDTVRRTSVFEAIVSLTEVGHATPIAMVAHIVTEEMGLRGTGPYPASLLWVTDSGTTPNGATGVLDTTGAAAPLFVLPDGGYAPRVDAATAGYLLPLLIAGHGRITLRSSTGGVGQGALRLVHGGEFHPACID